MRGLLFIIGYNLEDCLRFLGGSGLLRRFRLAEQLREEAMHQTLFRRYCDEFGFRDRPASIQCDKIGQTLTSA